MKYSHDCLRCGHAWTGRTEFPDKCVNCGSINYDTPAGANRPMEAILGHAKARNKQRTEQAKSATSPWNPRRKGAMSPLAADTVTLSKVASISVRYRTGR